jgi:putative intracellular protease/amidase
MSGSINVSRTSASSTTGTAPKRILMVVASPAISTTLGWPVGFWASEMTNPYYEFIEAGYDIELASPNGGKVEVDALSDPRHESGYSKHDLISMGFLNTPGLVALFENTKKLSEVNPDDYDAIMVCGGQSPMFTFRDNRTLQQLLARFYESEKPTVALCHGVASLMDVKLSDGSYLIKGKTITGFANVEENEADRIVGKQVMPWRIQDAAIERGANYIQGGLWKAFAVRDGRLITGQQQYSGAKVAKLLVEALGA